MKRVLYKYHVSKVLKKKYWLNFDANQGPYQKGKSAIDHIFTLLAIMQKYMSRVGGRF